MKYTLLMSLIAIFVGYVLGFLHAKSKFTLIYKRFTDEMHNQYLILLQKHGIKLSEEGKWFLKMYKG